MYTIADHASAF